MRVAARERRSTWRGPASGAVLRAHLINERMAYRRHGMLQGTRLGSSLCALLVLAVGAISAPAVFATDSYDIDPTHSHVVFKVLHFGVGENFGRFNEIGGSYSFDPESPAASKLEVEIKADSVDTGHEKRDQHLRSPDFFNAKQFPVIAFKSSKIEDKGDGLMHVTGKLSLHGVTKQVTIPVRFLGETDDPMGNHRSGFAADFTIRRSDYGMNFMIPGVSDEITLMVGVEGIRQ
jgi:polyisoprenoid-binding protein YceI